MPRKKKIDNAKLIQMVKDNVPQSELMATFGFKVSTQLKVAYANALMEAGAVPVLKTGRGKAAREALEQTAAVNKRGSLIVTKELVERFGYKVTDAFEVRKTKAGFTLKKI